MKLDESVTLNGGGGGPQQPASNDSSDSSMTESGSAAYCTFVVTGAVTSFQPIFVCHDCFHEDGTNGGDSNETTSPLCICQACADICHNGDDHDVEYIGMGPCYCDCDHRGKCTIRTRSQAQADRLLPPKSLDPIVKKFTRSNSDISNSDARLKSHLQRVFDVPCLQNPEMSAAIAEEAQELIRHSKETFWLDKDPAHSDSFCRLEAIAYKIYEHHRQHFDDLLFPDDQRGGAEWWVQVKDPNSSTGKDGAVDLHYDKDEALAEVFGLGSFPLLSTVTYITASSSRSQLFNPTIVLEHTYSQGEDDMINSMLVSQPIVGKHLVFDGKLLHGAPAHHALRTASVHQTTSPTGSPSTITENNTVSGSDPKRITFLVNIWKQKPANVHALPHDIRDVLMTMQLQSPLKNHEFDKFVMSRREIPIIPLEKEDDLPAHLRHRIELPFVSKGATWEDQLSCKDKGNNDDDDDDDDENNNDGLVVVLFPPPPVLSAGMDTFIVQFGPGLQAYMDYPHHEQQQVPSDDPSSISEHESYYV